MEPPTLTPAARRALDDYNTACRELAAAAHALKVAQDEYNRTFDAYQRAHGAACALGVV